MSRAKKKTSQLLALFLAAILVFSSLGSVAVAAAEDSADTGEAISGTANGGSDDCTISSYTLTDYLTDSDKSNAYQQNYQESSLTLEDGTAASYSTSLLQSAEWIDKAAGTAALNIHYTADFSEIELRSLYVFTTCTGHNFKLETAVENIMELLEYNDYVDIIMIGANNRKSNFYNRGDSEAAIGDAAAALMFSVRAEDGLDTDDIEEILTTYTNEELIDNGYVHELGCDSSDDGCCSSYIKDSEEYYEANNGEHTEGHYYDGENDSYGPFIEVLYSYVNYPFTFTYVNEGEAAEQTPTNTFETAAEFVLTFGDQRHSGELFTLYYIAKYIGIINESGVDFDTTVQAIFNSFDAFATSNRNLDQIFLTDNLYYELEKLYGVDFGTLNDTDSRLARENLNSGNADIDLQGALEKLGQYTTEYRYIVLIPEADTASGIYSYDLAAINALEDQAFYSLKNTLVFTLMVMNPNEEDSTNSAETATIPGHSDDEIWTVVNTLIRRTSSTTDTGTEDTTGTGGDSNQDELTGTAEQDIADEQPGTAEQTVVDEQTVTAEQDIADEQIVANEQAGPVVLNEQDGEQDGEQDETDEQGGTITEDTEISYDILQQFNPNIYTYVYTLAETGALDIVYEVINEVTITTIIISEFKITNVYEILVTNSDATTTSFDYTITIEEDTETGGTKVIIYCNNLTDSANTDTHVFEEEVGWGTSWSIDVSIPVQLVDNTEFRTSDDEFKDTNVEIFETEATVVRERIIYRYSEEGSDTIYYEELGEEHFDETVTVESPKLYKYETDDPGTTPDDDPGTTPDDDPGTTPDDDPGTTPDDDPGTTPDDDTSTTTSQITASPQTSDDSNITLWIALMLASCAGLTGIMLYRRKRCYR